MKKLLVFLLAAACTSCVTTQTPNQSSGNPQPTSTPAGGAAGGRVNITSGTAQLQQLSQLAASLKQSGFGTTLQGAGPFTVFAPSDSAFYKSGELPGLHDPAQINRLRKTMAYHIIMGRWFTQNFQESLNNGLSKLEFKTLTGEPIYVSKEGNTWVVTDQHGNKGSIEQANVDRTNGVVHVINKLLVP